MPSSSPLLPPLLNRGAYDLAARTVSWSEGATGAAPADLVRVAITGFRDDIPEGRAWRWKLSAPRTTTTVAFPILPSDGFDFNPAAGDTIAVSDIALAKLPGGYGRAVRERGFDDFKRFVAGASGRIVVERVRPEGL
jgi:hypothetical protein